MKTGNKLSIYFVDDEEAIRKVAYNTLRSVGYEVQCFKNGLECIPVLGTEDCNLLITDVKMSGMDGLELLEKAKAKAPWIPVLVITGYGDIPMAVRALKLGAADFIEKPLERTIFLSKIREIIDDSPMNAISAGDNLTRSEMQILKMILDGYSNRQMAATMNRSVRTIEMHRSHIMQKFGVSNIVDLVKRAAKIDFN